ncbi:MAG: pyridoxamine 5'-phosphate oxidase family protein [Rhizobiales bacterium]|nr:pyridoxamine 5'-phosphate oxidase family protein [Hyphomicrobiales bacterium]NRB14045.1 pyridoxamine 5'-phosphate oxidase family protein [Hyphomicrobiales bacterium]
MKKITKLSELTEIYGLPGDTSLNKEIDYINEHYRQFIEASPFCILATYGANGIDCSPRGDPAGFVRVVDEKHLLLPDRRGNNRLDSLKNIVENPQVGLIFLVPNAGEAIRVAGQAEIIIDAELNASFAMNGKPASSVLSIRVDKIYFQCQKAIARSKLWQPETFPDRSHLPTAGQMIKAFDETHNDEAYDKAYPARMKDTIY